MLVAYSMASTFVQTTLDYLLALKKFSGYEVDYLHVTHDAEAVVDMDSYDVVFQNYCSRLCFEGYVSESYRNKLRQFKGVKVIAVQDEYDRTDTLKAAIRDLGFDIVLTCVPQDSLEFVYPKAELPGVHFETVLTGYVPEGFLANGTTLKPLADRSILIGYRGRDIGGRYGRLGFDKVEIGRRMKEICDERGIATDIAMDEDSRIYGTAWLDFIGNCRAMLGSESGSNIFDFDGKIEERFQTLAKLKLGRNPTYAEFLPYVADREEQISMGQISPRVFECALMRTPMVLFRGRYSDAIVPDEHYIALEKDFSNVDEVLQRLADLSSLEAMAQRAYDHLVGSEKFSYRAFCGLLCDLIEDRLQQKNWKSVPSRIQEVPAFKGQSEDYRRLILTEFPENAPKGLAEFRGKQKCLGVAAVSASQRKYLLTLERVSRSYLRSIRSHLVLLDHIFGVVPPSSAAREYVQNERKRCDRFETEKRDHEKKIADLELRIQNMSDWDELAKLRDELVVQHQALLRTYVEFFESVQLLEDLHRFTLSTIEGVSRDGATSRKRSSLHARAILALYKAPKRVALSIFLRRTPKLRSYLVNVRQLVYGGH
jgi:hypothetical protein